MRPDPMSMFTSMVVSTLMKGASAQQRVFRPIHLFNNVTRRKLDRVVYRADVRRKHSPVNHCQVPVPVPPGNSLEANEGNKRGRGDGYLAIVCEGVLSKSMRTYFRQTGGGGGEKKRLGVANRP